MNLIFFVHFFIYMLEFLLWTLLFLQDKPYWQNKVYTVAQRGQIDAFQYEKKRKQKNRQNNHNIGGENRQKETLTGTGHSFNGLNC